MSQYPQYPTEPHDPNAPQGGSNPYGGAPGYGAPATPGVRPSSVSLAVKLLWGAIALHVIGGIANFATTGSLSAEFTSSGLSEEQADAVTSAALAIGAVLSLVLLGLYILLTVFIGKGANWARITTTVLVAIGALLTIPSLFTLGSTAAPVLPSLISLVQTLICIAAVVLCFRPDSNAWFKAPKAPRA